MSRTSQSQTNLKPSLRIVPPVVNPILQGHDRLDFTFRITPENFVAGAARSEMYKGLLIDNSGSMRQEDRGVRLRYAVIGACAAVDRLGDDDLFSAGAFAVRAGHLTPGSGAVRANRSNRWATKKEIENLPQVIALGGGTCISTGIELLTNDFLALEGADEGMIGLLTDGQNNDNDRRPLQIVLSRIAELRRTRGRILKIHCRGVGDDWDVEQLRQIAEATLGSEPVLIENPSDLGSDFEGLFHEASNRLISNVKIVIAKPRLHELISIRQVAPSIVDLTKFGQLSADENTIAFSTGSWENEQPRLFHVAMRLRKPATRDEVHVCNLALEYSVGRTMFYVPDPDANDPDTEALRESLSVNAHWSNDVSLTSRIEPDVALATGVVQSAEAMQAGIRALNKGDRATATERLGEAVRIASELGHTEVLERLATVVEIQDAGTGTVRLRPDATRADTMRLDAGSTRTVRLDDEPAPAKP